MVMGLPDSYATQIDRLNTRMGFFETSKIKKAINAGPGRDGVVVAALRADTMVFF